MNYIGKYPMLIINDPTNPDGACVKRFCDKVQLYEKKYGDAVPILQRASIVLTLNHAPEFITSGMDAKIQYCHTVKDYRGKEISDSEYMSTIKSDGSLRDLWQMILRHVINDTGIVIPDEEAVFNEEMHNRTDSFNRWLGLCTPSDNRGVKIHDVYLNYMIYANPESERQYVIDTCNVHKKNGRWRPRGGLQGKSKHELITEMMAVGFKFRRIKEGERQILVTLPE